jgi:2-alkyl-3-oxoalkanoate reductase
MPPLTDAASKKRDAPAILVTGSTGFLGRAVVRAFARAGYEVRGLARDLSKAETVRADGGVPRLGDMLDPRSLQSAAEGCSGIVHLAANPPAEGDAERVRVGGARHLLEISRRLGVSRLVIGSGYWVYGSQTELITEATPVDPRGESRINYDTERVGLEAQGTGRPEVVVGRPGMVYGPGSWFRELADSIRAGTYRVGGDGSNRWSFVDREDTGTAYVKLFEAGTAGEVYNIVDGRPATLREFVDFVADRLGAAHPPSVTWDEAVGRWGSVVAHHLTADRPTSNRKLAGLGWTPRWPDYRDEVSRLCREMGGSSGPSS